jgi:hypothetical protein
MDAMFGRRIRGAVEGVAAQAHGTLDKTDQLIALIKDLAVAITDDVRDFVREAGDEVNVEATLRLADDFDLKALLSGTVKEIPVSLNLKIRVKE